MSNNMFFGEGCGVSDRRYSTQTGLGLYLLQRKEASFHCSDVVRSAAYKVRNFTKKAVTRCKIFFSVGRSTEGEM